MLNLDKGLILPNIKVPNQWVIKSVQDFGTVKRGAGSQYIKYLESGGIRLIRINDFFENKPVYVEPTEDILRFIIEDNDILFAGTGASAGASYIPNPEWLGLPHSYNAPKIKIKKGENRIFLLYALQSEYIAMQQKKLFVGAAQPFLDINSISNFKILTPPPNEQKAIARILGLMDNAIKINNQLLAQKELRKKWLMQNLLTGKKKLKGFKEEWKETSLGNLFNKINRKNTELNKNVITISGKRGFIKQTEFFNKSIAGEKLDNYFLVLKGEFCYNKSYSYGYPWGATKRLNNFDKAVVTTLYICFNIKDENLTDGDFFEQFFEANSLDKGLTKIAHEGGRAHGLLNVTPDDFFSLKIFVPGYEEQKAIAHILKVADKEIELLKKKIEKLKEQKKGLMQVLLTGKLRILNF